MQCCIPKQLFSQRTAPTSNGTVRRPRRDRIRHARAFIRKPPRQCMHVTEPYRPARRSNGAPPASHAPHAKVPPLTPPRPPSHPPRRAQRASAPARRAPPRLRPRRADWPRRIARHRAARRCVRRDGAARGVQPRARPMRDTRRAHVRGPGPRATRRICRVDASRAAAAIRWMAAAGAAHVCKCARGALAGCRAPLPPLCRACLG